jgi:hypothetical protein
LGKTSTFHHLYTHFYEICDISQEKNGNKIKKFPAKEDYQSDFIENYERGVKWIFTLNRVEGKSGVVLYGNYWQAWGNFIGAMVRQWWP